MTPLFTVSFEHGYFPDGKLQHFQVAPLADTARLMARYQLRLHAQDGAFRLLGWRVDSALLDCLLTQAVNGELSFLLCCDPAQFFAITQIPDDWLGTLRLTSQAASLELACAPGELWAGRGEAVALLTLRLEHLLAAAPGPCYQVAFEARSMGWDYYLINRSEVVLRAPAVVGRDGQRFEGPAIVQLQGGERALHFSSGARRFALQHNPSQTFDLVDRFALGPGQPEVEHCYLKGLPTPGRQQWCRSPQQANCAMYVYL